MNITNMAKVIKTSFIVFSPVLVGACAAYQNEPVVYDSTFGQSVNQIKQAQILNPKAAHNPPLDPPKHLDGYVGETIINSYREGAQDTEQIESVNINLGGSGQ